MTSRARVGRQTHGAPGARGGQCSGGQRTPSCGGADAAYWRRRKGYESPLAGPKNQRRYNGHRNCARGTSQVHKSTVLTNGLQITVSSPHKERATTSVVLENRRARTRLHMRLRWSTNSLLDGRPWLAGPILAGMREGVRDTPGTVERDRSRPRMVESRCLPDERGLPK